MTTEATPGALGSNDQLGPNAELDTNLRLRELGGAKQDEAMTPFLERVIAERDAMRAALLDCARKAERLKKPCGMDPEGYQAVRNGQYQNISTTAHVALGTILGPNVRGEPQIAAQQEMEDGTT